MARIARVRVRSYKAFEDSGDVLLGRRFTVVIGRNNGGKTALLQAIANRISATPHRSQATVPERGRQAPPTELEVDLACGVDDFVRVAHAGNQISVPLPRNVDWQDPNRGLAEARTLLPDGALMLHVKRMGNGGWEPNANGYTIAFTPSDYALLKANGRISHSSSPVGNWPAIAASHISSRVYMFNAERLRIDTARVSHETSLSPNAGNLAACLHTLQSSNFDLFEELNRRVNEILPEVKWVSVPTVAGGSPIECQVRVWLVDRKTQRDDLALPLSECGTGVGQVLALLYVVLTTDAPTTIVIDEPQSFLHPGATWKLMELLRERSDRHQFVVSTHSPGVVAAVDPEVVLSVSLRGERAEVKSVELTEVAELRTILAEVGSRWSDVFGADRVLWVEGHTEEAFIPKLLHQCNTSLVGTRVVGVVNTGDFESRHKPKVRLVREIYDKLSSGSALIPPPVAFVFDQDGKTSEEMAEVARESGGRVHFLKRRLFENYLLEADAIAAFVERHGGSGTVPQFQERLDRAFSRGEGLPRDVASLVVTLEDWKREVHGANLIESILAESLGKEFEFRKTRDSTAIAEWLLNERPETLAELADTFRDALAVALDLAAVAAPRQA